MQPKALKEILGTLTIAIALQAPIAILSAGTSSAEALVNEWNDRVPKKRTFKGRKVTHIGNQGKVTIDPSKTKFNYENTVFFTIATQKNPRATVSCNIDFVADPETEVCFNLKTGEMTEMVTRTPNKVDCTLKGRAKISFRRGFQPIHCTKILFSGRQGNAIRGSLETSAKLNPNDKNFVEITNIK
jgi:hypothetical protein